MRIVATFADRKTLRSFERMAGNLADGRWKKDASRGVVDAGRKTKTQVQRAVAKQMAIAAGQYQGLVVPGMRQKNDAAAMSSTIFAIPGGQRIEKYKGLRSVKRPSKSGDGGSVKSAVWNAPRIFARSFAADDGYFATLPGGKSTTAPKRLWTFGAKPDQPRGEGGRFASTGVKYGKIRRLYGPSLRDEIGEGEALATFVRVAPVELETKVSKRLERHLKF